MNLEQLGIEYRQANRELKLMADMVKEKKQALANAMHSEGKLEVKTNEIFIKLQEIQSTSLDSKAVKKDFGHLLTDKHYKTSAYERLTIN